LSTETATAIPPARLKRRYEDEVRPKLQERFGYASPMQHPRIEKITLNMGVGDAKANSKALDDAVEELAIISGQRPAITRARKSIAQFKLREGMPIGAKVTLRGARMWEFLDRLNTVALPRIRDFRGINPDGFDGRGNYNLGLREQTIFPEIDYDKVGAVRGLNVTITTSAATDEEAKALLQELGMPFREQGYTAEERAARRRKKMRKFRGRKR
jgi:large subunit ribosomal protein L5